MLKASQQQNGVKIAELSRSIHSCRMTIDRLFNELEEVTGLLDTQKAVFDQKLKQLEGQRISRFL